jgi:hypothetical protein
LFLLLVQVMHLIGVRRLIRDLNVSLRYTASQESVLAKAIFVAVISILVRLILIGTDWLVTLIG